MSQRVSYYGYESGFPFPIKHQAVDGSAFELWDGTTLDGSGLPVNSGTDYVYGHGTYHPTGMSLVKLAELFWRVKSLEFYFDYIFYYDGGSDTIGPDSGLVAAINATSESQLCKTAFNYYQNDSGSLGVGFPDFYEIRVRYDDVWKIGDLYYPNVYFGLGGIFNVIGTGDITGRLDLPVSGLLVDFMGIENIPLYGTAVLGTVGISSPYSGSGTIQIRALEYWSYDYTWDTTTGAPY